jgi:hypothetical protein
LGFAWSDSSSNLHEVLGPLPKQLIDWLFSRIPADAQESAQNPGDVSVQHRGRLIKGNAADGASRVTANPWQSQHGCKIPWKLAAMVSYQNFGGLLYVSGALIITEAFPKLEDSFGPGPGHPLQRGQRPHPSDPERQDRVDLGLLQHDFGDPDCVRIAGLTPGQGTCLSAVPGEQDSHDGPDLAVGVGAKTAFIHRD